MKYSKADDIMLRQLFEQFIDAGLTGQFEKALALMDDSYSGIGMGEQGIVKSKEQAAIVLHGSYRPAREDTIKYDIKNLTVNFLDEDVAIVFGEVVISNKPKNGQPMYSGMMQTIGAKYKGDKWKVAFTHASPTTLTVESVEAYPIRFMDHTISILKAGLQAETVLYAEINLTKNKVVQVEFKIQECETTSKEETLEDVVACGVYGDMETSAEEEYYAFWKRERLLGLFVEGVVKDSFDYRMETDRGLVWLRATVELVRKAYSADVLAVISYASLDNQKMELEQFAHKASHDALTGILNREGFESRVAELLREYDPKNNTALFMIDLDDFKQINDRLGHQVGDTVLKEVANTLRTIFRNDDAVGRVGGDEFMVLLTGRVSVAFLEKKASELLRAMKLQIGDSKRISLSVSIGIACGRVRATFEKYYRIADIALYTAKKAGKCRYHLIDADTNMEHSDGDAEDQGSLMSLQSLLEYTDEKETSQSKSPYEALLENIPGGVVVLEVTPTTVKLTHCNEWANIVLGRSQEEIRALQLKDPFVFVHPEDLPLIADIIRRVRDGADSFNAIYRVCHKNGTYKYISMAASTTERSANCVIMQGIDTDVDEVIRLKKDVESAHSQLATLVDMMPGGLAVYELKGTLEITHYGTWACEFSGYSSNREIEQVRQGEQLGTIWPEDIARTKEALRQVREEGLDTLVLSLRVKCKDGSARWADIRGTVIERNEKKVTMYMVHTESAQLSLVDSSNALQ